ncbi:MAG: hypothetical protein KGQ59_00335, partial [Bdellovibrionales bacterium]|nr:hypothetical protein [Bdellovibrionales bacterium]
MKRFIVLVFFAAVSALLAEPARAEVVLKHPRVAELEDKLTRDASTYLKGRFPNSPFMVTVSIDPLRRVETKAAGAGSGEAELPYLDWQSSDEVRDEWDDPQVSLGGLMVRVKRAKVSISLPHSTMDDEAKEIKDSIFSFLNLMPARDEVVIERRKWSDSRDSQWIWIGAAALMIFVVLGGMHLIHRSSSSKLASALMSVKNQAGAGGVGAGAVAMESAGMASAGGPEAQGSGGDVSFSDPIRIRELTVRLIDSIIEDGAFPNLADMLILDQLGRRDASQLGALLAEFPLEQQKILFSRSSGTHWLEAFRKPGSLDLKTLNVLQTLAHNLRDPQLKEQQDVFIYVWRLEEQMTGFIQRLNHSAAIAILSGLPKSISIGVARKAFPGNWAVLLDTKMNPPQLSSGEMKTIATSALSARPLQSFSDIQRYRNEVELVEYLKGVDIAEEREIYGASPQDSMIHRIRKPFFLVFEQQEAVLRDLVSKVSLGDWALSLFNVNRQERRMLESLFSEKQRF